MLIKDFNDYYNQNPPEPIAYPMENDPNELDQYAVEEHIYEKNYEAQSLRHYLDLEDAELNELIKHECCKI